MEHAYRCLTTMIGSMPQASASEALALLDAHRLDVPAWPQLPRRAPAEGMVPQVSEGLPGLRSEPERGRFWIQRDDELAEALAGFYEAVIAEEIDALALSPAVAAGLHAFLERWRGAAQRPARLKGQLTGPFTLGLGLTDQDRKPVWFDAQYRDVIYQALGLKARWLVRELRALADEVWLFYDEPICSALGTPAYMAVDDAAILDGFNQVIRPAQQAGARVGIHCCGNMDWGLLAQTDVDLIAFDAHDYGDKLALYAQDLGAFLGRGGTLAYGLVPTGDPEVLAAATCEDLVRRLRDLQGLLVQRGVPSDLLAQRLVLTPSCGMGTLSPEAAERVLQLLAELRARLLDGA